MRYLLIVDNVFQAIKGLVHNIRNGVQYIVDGIQYGLDFIGDLISDIFTIGKYFSDAFRLISDAIDLLPNFVKFMAVILIAVFVIFQIVGRESGAKN